MFTFIAIVSFVSEIMELTIHSVLLKLPFPPTRHVIWTITARKLFCYLKLFYFTSTLSLVLYNVWLKFLVSFVCLSFLTTRLSNTPYPCYSAFEVHIDNWYSLITEYLNYNYRVFKKCYLLTFQHHVYLQGSLYLATRKFPYCIKDSVHIVKNNIFCFVQDEQRKRII